MASELKVDTVSEKTTGSGVTVDGVELKDGSVKGNGTGRKNYIINGNFDIWQRGTTGTGGYCSADRWSYETSGTTGTFAQGVFTLGQTDVPNNPKYFANLTVTGANDNAALTHRIEDVVTLSGETATVSFYYKHTTNAPTNFDVVMYQVFGTGGSTFTTTNISTGNTTTTSWQKFTGTFTLPSVSGKTSGAGNHIKLAILNPNNETFDIQIAQVQVEKGSVATDFEVRPIGEEYQNCFRYYNRYVADDTVYCLIAQGTYNSGTQILVKINHPVKMRTAPTMSYSQLSDFDIEPFDVAPTAITYGYNSHLVTQLSVTDPTSRTRGFCGQLTIDVANGYLELDAEL